MVVSSVRAEKTASELRESATTEYFFFIEFDKKKKKKFSFATVKCKFNIKRSAFILNLYISDVDFAEIF